MSLSSPAGNEMFQFPAFALPVLCVRTGVTAGHARTFQRSRLRASRTCYGSFTLPTGRSRGFGPIANDLTRVEHSLSLRLRHVPGLASPLTITRRPIMQKVRRHPLPALLLAIGLRPLVSAGFQVLLTRLVAVLFIVQSPYLSTIGHRGVFSLGRWSAPLRAEFHELRATLESTC